MNTQRHKCINRLVFSLTVLIGLALQPISLLAAQEEADNNAGGQFLTVTGTIDDAMSSRIINLGLKLQNQAIQEDREIVFVLEISSGSSRFGQVRDVAKFLTSAKVNRLRTVAWVPSAVTGRNAILALACEEIILHPDAQLGDIGRGEPIDADEQQFVMDLVRGRHNRMVSPALAKGMMNKAVALSLVTKQTPDGKETQVLSRAEIREQQDAGVAILDVVPIKEAGARGAFTGRQASEGGFLVVQSREDRRDVADLYRLPLEAMREEITLTDKSNVRLIKIDGGIDPIIDTFVRRQIDRCVADGANVIIFQIESPGGFVDSGLNLANAIADLEDQDVRTIAYVPTDAISMAAVIALSCDEIYMLPEARIGDAEIIELRDGAFHKVP